MGRTPLKIGHRGAAGRVTENTWEAFQKAMELGVDGIELDAHAYASGELVVFHDVRLDRITNGHGDIAKHTLKALKKLKVTRKLQVPTLIVVLDLLDNKCRCYQS